MKRDIAIPQNKFNSSFLSYEKDMELILKKLFVTSRPFDEDLKRLLVINTKDCLDSDSEVYKAKIAQMTLPKLLEDGYVTMAPRIEIDEHEEMKSYIVITMDDFTMNDTNPEFRDCSIVFDVLCPTTQWDLGNYRIRPLKIAGYIDAIFNEAKLTGIGKLHFMGCQMNKANDDLAGYTLMYRAVHGSDDQIEP